MQTWTLLLAFCAGVLTLPASEARADHCANAPDLQKFIECSKTHTGGPTPAPSPPVGVPNREAPDLRNFNILLNRDVHIPPNFQSPQRTQ
jgi:hypothetical protein